MNVHGIGLGLNISSKILDQFGGNIKVNSIEGEGSSFIFTIKLFENLNIDQADQSLEINPNELCFIWKAPDGGDVLYIKDLAN